MEKSIRLCIITAAAIGICFLVTGCLTGTTETKTTITEFDSEGKVVKTTVTDASTESIVASVMNATREKSVVVWDNSFKAYLSVSWGAVDNPTPHVDAGIGKNDRGYFSLHKNHDSSDGERMIQAARAQEISIKATGMETSSGNKGGADKETTNEEATKSEAKVGSTEAVDQGTVVPILGLIVDDKKKGGEADGGAPEQPED